VLYEGSMSPEARGRNLRQHLPETPTRSGRSGDFRDFSLEAIRVAPTRRRPRFG
jgi:hypothetical protein